MTVSYSQEYAKVENVVPTCLLSICKEGIRMIKNLKLFSQELYLIFFIVLIIS